MVRKMVGLARDKIGGLVRELSGSAIEMGG
jgi:hypothetical protein